MGAPTGILDQSASVLCTAGHALFLDTRDRASEQVPLDLAAAGLELLVVDSGVTHEHAGAATASGAASASRRPSGWVWRSSARSTTSPGSGRSPTAPKATVLSGGRGTS